MMRASEAALRSLRAMQAAREKAGGRRAGCVGSRCPARRRRCGRGRSVRAPPPEGGRPDPPSRPSAQRLGADGPGSGAGHHHRHHSGPACARPPSRPGNSQGRLTRRNPDRGFCHQGRASSAPREARYSLLRGSPWPSHVLRVETYAKLARKHRRFPQIPEAATWPHLRGVSSPESRDIGETIENPSLPGTAYALRKDN